MEKFTKNHFIMFTFVAMGLLFSSYMAGVKLFSDVCAFGASCPMFLGYPACYTGFVIYLVLTIITILSIFKKELSRIMLVSITGVSFFGVLFSGKLTLIEMSVLFNEGFVPFIKSLPLCSLALIIYAVIFILSIIIGKDCTDPCCGYCNPKSKDKSDKAETTPINDSSADNRIESTAENHISKVEEKMFEDPIEENKVDDTPLIM